MNNKPILYDNYNSLIIDKELSNEVFYVYILLDQRSPGNYVFDNYKFKFEPYYVGKGKKDRVKTHFYGLRSTLEETRQHNPDNFLCISKTFSIWESLKEYPYFVIIKYFKGLTAERDALDLEKHLINLLGRQVNFKGPLTNIATENYLSADMKSLNLQPEYLERLKNRNERISKNKKGKKMSPESIERSRLGLIRYYETHTVWNKGIPRSEETKEKIKNTKKERRLFNPNYGKPSAEGLEKIRITSSLRQQKLKNNNPNISIWVLKEKEVNKFYILFGGINRFLKSKGDSYQKLKAKIRNSSKFSLVRRFKKEDIIQLLKEKSEYLKDDFESKEFFIKELISDFIKSEGFLNCEIEFYD